jgi:hypothetical protein
MNPIQFSNLTAPAAIVISKSIQEGMIFFIGGFVVYFIYLMLYDELIRR